MRASFASTVHANTTPLTIGAWHLIGISIAGGSGTFYVNGVADGTFSSYAGYSVNRLLNIPSGALWAKGGFRDFALWIGTALTAQQHAALYAARTLNRSAMGWTGKLVRCDRMAYRMRERRLDLDVREWVTLT